MKVALLGPVAWRTPPRHYGPWEQVTGLLAEGLAGRGVDVTLFATLDSVTSASLDGVCPRGYADDPTLDGRAWEAMHISHALARSAEFDLVHNHLDWLPLAFAAHCRVPLLTTVHGFSGPGILPAYARRHPLHGPRRSWELIQVGNCGSPIETEAGWLVLTHGVGPMRRYAIGALLLDLDHPERVVAELPDELLVPDDAEREGYVPNVVYSCGGLVHAGTLWLPYGASDGRVGFATIPLAALLAAMRPVNPAPAV